MQPPIGDNFNLLRLTFAVMVSVYHVVLIIPEWVDVRSPTSLFAEIGVQAFFVLSGYLVFASFENSPSLAVYVEKRFRRLYPAYAVVIPASAVGAVVFSADARADLVGVLRYTGWNLVFANFMEPNLPGIFVEDGGAPVNGALWALKIEVMFYLILPLPVWLLRASGKYVWIVFLLIYASAEFWRFSLNSIEQYDLAHQLPGQMSFFITGMALYRQKLSGWRLHVAGVLGVLLVAASILSEMAEPVRALGLGALVVWIATGWIRVPDPARFGDLSYGIYIVHFPIIQTVAVLGIFQIDRWLGVVAALIISFMAAFLLWHLIERPALRADSAYRRQRA